MTFYHALQVNEDVCEGCAHCMKVCPMEAIRVREGKAHISEHRCIDCGKCYKECPHHAIFVKQDDFDNIFKFKCRVLIVPSVFYGQFSKDINAWRIYNIIKSLGFDHVVDTEISTPIYTEAKNKIECEGRVAPLISSYCPAIVRLIQVKFPGLIDNLLQIKAPVDLTAMYVRRRLEKEGVRREDIGIFYVTPCAAKIAAVKSPVGESKSIVDGVINMDSLYNKVYKKIKEQGRNYQEDKKPEIYLSPDSVLTSLTNGERRLSKAPHSLSIDEITNVIEFLEKVENDEIEDVEFLELRACDQSCPGGILTCNNRFLTCEKMFGWAREIAEAMEKGEKCNDDIQECHDFLLDNIKLGTVKPRSMLSLDDDISKALDKMEKINELKRILPQIDCGMCGAPTCDALAEDIVCRNSKMAQCVFIQRHLEKHNTLEVKESLKIMNDIWGEDRIKC